MNKLLKYREKLAILLVDYTKPIYVKWYKKKQKPWNQNTTSLKKFPEGSLGNRLGHFLEANQFELLPKLEDHDVLHVLLDFNTTITGEIKMQFFLLGNRKRSVYAFFTALTGTLLVPEKIFAFIKEFTKGRRCAAVSKWNFEFLLAEPLELLQKQVFGDQLKNQPFRI